MSGFVAHVDSYVMSSSFFGGKNIPQRSFIEFLVNLRVLLMLFCVSIADAVK